jgi:MerR family transcriptional regulator, heat shock protein HspR
MDAPMDRNEREARLKGSDERAVYIISVAAELAGVHPQTLRIYERKGLLRPKRTSGNTRRYSQRDIELLRAIHELTREAGVNLAGVKQILELQAEVLRLQERITDLESELRKRRAVAMPGKRQRKDMLPLRSLFSPPWREGS